jgi:serine protease Do
MQANLFKRSAVALAVAGAFATGIVMADRVGVHAAPAAPGAAVTAVAPAAGAMTSLPDFANLVAKHGPAVVHISVTQDVEKVAARSGRGMPDLGEMFPGFPGFPGFRGFPHPDVPDNGPTQGVGSGFIASS